MEIVFASEKESWSRNWASALKQALPEARVRTLGDGRPEGGADIAVVWSPPADLFAREPGIKCLFNLGAGVDALMRLPGLPADVTVVRVEDGGMAVQMAEYVLYYLLQVSRDFGRYAQFQHAARWEPLPHIERGAWPIGIMGAGVMGARIAHTRAALEDPVAVWSRSGREIEGAQSFGGTDGLQAFLARTRVLVNVLPLTPETEGILCRSTFDRLLPEAYVINIARGGHLVDADLLACLDEGRLRGAALDVFHHEPLPPDHPFWRDDRICVTPHIAGASLLDETVRQTAAKIRAFVRGEAVSGVVDRTLQY